MGRFKQFLQYSTNEERNATITVRRRLYYNSVTTVPQLVILDQKKASIKRGAFLLVWVARFGFFLLLVCFLLLGLFKKKWFL